MKAIVFLLLFVNLFHFNQTKENMTFFRCGTDDHYKAPIPATHIIDVPSTNFTEAFIYAYSNP